MRIDRARFSPSHGSDVVDAFHGTCKRTHYLHELGDVMHACLFDDDSLACLRRTGVHATASSPAAFFVLWPCLRVCMATPWRTRFCAILEILGSNDRSLVWQSKCLRHNFDIDADSALAAITFRRLNYRGVLIGFKAVCRNKVRHVSR